MLRFPILNSVRLDGRNIRKRRHKELRIRLDEIRSGSLKIQRYCVRAGNFMAVFVSISARGDTRDWLRARHLGDLLVEETAPGHGNREDLGGPSDTGIPQRLCHARL